MKSYLKIGGKSLRVEINWNAHIEYCSLKGISDLSGLDNMANLSASDLLDFIFCAVKEGERMDGREFKLNSQDLGSLMKTPDIISFMNIYKIQSQIEASKSETSVDGVKKKKLFHLKNSKE